ncbi:cytochrome c [cf. Phormidesmis sp. LEGE 11477]|nr:cytochrome c [cf. Phormidesmis sp. LEGE 11477]
MLRVVTRVFQKETVPNQAVNSPTENDKDAVQSAGQLAPRALSILVGLLFFVCVAIGGVYALAPNDPYVQDVLQLTGDADRGHDIFQLNCATCHGLYADGEVGPDLHNVSERRSRAALITQVISGQTPPMPQFQPNERDMADLLAFLETL